jgi:hypothetical protein
MPTRHPSRSLATVTQQFNVYIHTVLNMYRVIEYCTRHFTQLPLLATFGKFSLFHANIWVNRLRGRDKDKRRSMIRFCASTKCKRWSSTPTIVDFSTDLLPTVFTCRRWEMDNFEVSRTFHCSWPALLPTFPKHCLDDTVEVILLENKSCL